MRRWLLMFLLLPSLAFATTARYSVPSSDRIRSKAANQHTDYSADTTIQFGAYTPVVTYVDTLVPTANGTYTAWTGDYTAVDEVTSSDVDYIYSSSVDQEESYKKTAYTRSGNPDSIVVYWRAQRSGGIASYVGVFADTTGDGTDNYDVTLTASQLLSTSWTTYTVKLGPISNAAADSLKIKFIYVAKTSTATARVSWLQLLAYQRDPGDINRTVVGLPTAIVRTAGAVPILPDSVKLSLYLFDINDSLTLRLRMAGIKNYPGGEVGSSYPDWVHKAHASSESWYVSGADSARGGDTAADRSTSYTEVTVDSATKYGTYFSIGLDSGAIRRAWDGTWGTSPQVLLYSPSEKDSSTMYALSENAGSANKPYWEFFYSERKPTIAINGPANQGSVRGYDTVSLIATFTRDSTDGGTLDSVIWYAKPQGRTAWQPVSNWWNRSSSWGIHGDSTELMTALPWFTPNAAGPCSLRVQGYTSWGNSDTDWIEVTIVPSSYIEYPMTATYINSGLPNNNFGAIPSVSATSTTRILAKATGITTPATVPGVYLSGPRYAIKFIENGVAFYGDILTASPTTKTWNAGDNEGTSADTSEATWNSARRYVQDWSSAGGDFDATKVDTLYIAGSDASGSGDTAVCLILRCVVGDSIAVGITLLADAGGLGVQCADSLVLIQAWDYIPYTSMSGTSGWCRTGEVSQNVSDTVTRSLGITLPGTPRAAIFFITSNPSQNTWGARNGTSLDANFSVTYYIQSAGGSGAWRTTSTSSRDSTVAGSAASRRYSDGTFLASWTGSASTATVFQLQGTLSGGTDFRTKQTKNTQGFTNVQIVYWIVGGSNLTDANIVTVQTNNTDATAGKKTVALGTTTNPAMLFFLSNNLWSANNSPPGWSGANTNAYLNLGFAVASAPTTKRGCLGLNKINSAFTVGSHFYNDYSLAFWSTSALVRTITVDSVKNSNAYLAMNTDANRSTCFMIMAICGGAWDAGMDTLKAITDEVKTVSTAFTPEGALLFATDNTTEAYQNTSNSSSFGVATDNSSGWVSQAFGNVLAYGVARTLAAPSYLGCLFNEQSRSGTIEQKWMSPTFNAAPNFQTQMALGNGAIPLFHWVVFADNLPAPTYQGSSIGITGD
jgi:hypothetical protein